SRASTSSTSSSARSGWASWRCASSPPCWRGGGAGWGCAGRPPGGGRGRGGRGGGGGAPPGSPRAAAGSRRLARGAGAGCRPEAEVRAAQDGEGRLAEGVVPARRGHEEVVERRVEVSDAFALTRIAFLRREPRPVRVVPSTGALDRVRLSRTVSGGDDTY